MSAKQKDVGSSPAHDQNFFVQVLFRLGETFFAIFYMSPKGPRFIFFLLCKRMGVQKLPKATLLHFSALCDLPETKKNSKEKFRKKNSKKFGFSFKFFPHAGTVKENAQHIEVLLLFLSLRYGADLDRSRLVSIAFANVPTNKLYTFVR